MLIRRTLSNKTLHLRFFSQAAVAVNQSSSVFAKPDPKYAETILAIPRATSGKSIAAKERKLGRLPRIVFEEENGQYGGNKRLISAQTNQMRKLVTHLGQSFFPSRLFDLEVRSEFGTADLIEKARVLPRMLKVDVPLVFRGE